MAFSTFLRRASSSRLLSQSYFSAPRSHLRPSPSIFHHASTHIHQSPASSSSSSSYSSLPSYMRAAVFSEPNKPLTIQEFHMPRPKAGEVLIKIKACGVCHSDLHVMKGEIPFPSPCVVGHEITGEVVEHGSLTDRKTIERLPIGAHVVGAFIMPCGNCSYCSKGHDDLCEDFFAYNRAKGTLYDGETRLFLRKDGKPIYMYSMGGLAEYCVTPAHGVSVLPNSLPYTESAILGCAVFTAYGAMAHAAEVRPGDSVAIIGIGGVGSRGISSSPPMEPVPRTCIHAFDSNGDFEISLSSVEPGAFLEERVFEDPYLLDTSADAFETLCNDDAQDNLSLASQPLPLVIIPASVPSKFSSVINAG